MDLAVFCSVSLYYFHRCRARLEGGVSVLLEYGVFEEDGIKFEVFVLSSFHRNSSVRNSPSNTNHTLQDRMYRPGIEEAANVSRHVTKGASAASNVEVASRKNKGATVEKPGLPANFSRFFCEFLRNVYLFRRRSNWFVDGKSKRIQPLVFSRCQIISSIIIWSSLGNPVRTSREILMNSPHLIGTK